MMHKTVIFVILFSSINSIVATAHPNSHSVSPERNRIWRLKDKTIALNGVFYFYKNGKVFVSTPKNKIVSFDLSQLSWMDNDFVKKEIDRIERVNSIKPIVINLPVGQNKSFPWLSTIIFTVGILLIAILYFGGYLVFESFEFKPIVGTSIMVWLVVFLIACKKDSTTSSVTPSTITKNDPSTMAAAFVPYKAYLTTRYDANYFYIDSPLGLPAHNMMVGITNWQQQVPIPQPYTGSNAWSIPLTSEVATVQLSAKSNFMKGAMAVAVNGIPIFNALNNRGEDSYLIGELDNWGGHCGKADDYHYHIPPMHLSATSGTMPIAYALDGYPVYGSTEADGSAMTALDDFHGHSASDGIYHYHATTTYPYMIATMRGKVTLDPSTTAPENQIIPQASTKPIRPATSPLNGAKIVNFSVTSTTSYKLEYQINSASGFISYSWDATKYTFTFTDTSGSTTTETYTK